LETLSFIKPQKKGFAGDSSSDTNDQGTCLNIPCIIWAAAHPKEAIIPSGNEVVAYTGGKVKNQESKDGAFWDIAPCSLIEVHPCFRSL
jgi:hypothetical protein